MATSTSSIGSLISGLIHKGAQFATKIADLMKDPIGGATKIISPIVDKLANILPFGLGKLIGPFVQKFMGSVLNWLSKGPLAGLTALVQKLAPTAQKLASFVQSLDKLFGGSGISGLQSAVKQNISQVVAYAQAKGISAPASVSSALGSVASKVTDSFTPAATTASSAVPSTQVAPVATDTSSVSAPEAPEISPASNGYIDDNMGFTDPAFL